MNRTAARIQKAMQVACNEASPAPSTVVALVVHPENLQDVQTGAPNLMAFTDQTCTRGHMFPVEFQHMAKFDQLLRQGQGPMQAWRHRKEPLITPLTKLRDRLKAVVDHPFRRGQP